MRLLLDTHIMLWWALGNTRLTPAARTLIADAAQAKVVSIASVWEVAIKHGSNRASSMPVDAATFAGFVSEAGFALLPVEVPHLLEVERLPQSHGDPFDRLLVATARADGLRLMTHDETLAAYGDHVMVV